jgi:putative membrane protein
MTTMPNERRSNASRLAILALPVIGALVFPSASFAATGSSTVRAILAGDGSVKSVKMIAADGTSSAFSGTVPLKMSISRTTSGTTSTYTYHVQNVDTQQKDITYTDTQGKSHTSSVQLQLPLVAQLGVSVPKTFKDVATSNGVVSEDPNGASRVLWQLVMFSPLGSPSQDVTFTASGTGAPTAELVATAVDPSATAGLSQAQQAATANIQQDDVWQALTGGGNGGLGQLAAGTGQLVTGLEQLFAGASKLHTGLAAAGAGATKLDAGTKSAKDGAVKLSSGLGQISGGLGQLADPAKGLPAAVAGIAQIDAGVKAILAGVGDDATAKTLINGLDGLKAGVQAIEAGFTDPKAGIVVGLSCAADLASKAITGASAAVAAADPCFLAFGLPALPGADPATAGALTVVAGTLGKVLTGLNTQVLPGLKQIETGAGLLRAGLSHPAGAAGATDSGGVKEGLTAIDAGLQQVQAGVGAAATGASKLAAGSGLAFTGSQTLASGLGLLSTGQHQVATGLPAAVTGSGSIATGLGQALGGAKQVGGGITAVQSGAVSPLNTQLVQGSQNAHKTVAVLQAAGALAAQAPGGAGTAYVLTQSPNGFTLAADTTSSTNDSHTARNVGIGLGGLVALIIAVVAGFAMGRRGGAHA